MTSPRRLRTPGLGLGLATLLVTSACSSTPAGAPTSPPADGASRTGTPVTASSVAPTPAGRTPGLVDVGSVRQHSYWTADGSCALPASLLGRDVERLGIPGKRIALTFDGGADNKAVEKILSTLETKKAVATFFFTGKFAEANPALIRRIAARYPIGNHSYSHPGFAVDLKTRAERVKQIEDAEAAITKASGGIVPMPYFRFPKGEVDKAGTVIADVNSACYVPFRWSIDTLGWVGTKGDGVFKGRTVQSVTDKVLKAPAQKKDGGIVLMHVGAATNDGSTLDSDALPAIIDGLRAQGYQFVTLQAALKAAR